MTAAVPVKISVKPHVDGLDGRVMPLEGPLVDRYGRVHSDLRISVTDRCNLRCVYCMPEEGLSFLPQPELLSFDEILRVARVARGLGITAVRITGGEPLMRKGLPELVGGLAQIGFDDVAMTTNGTKLARGGGRAGGGRAAPRQHQLRFAAPRPLCRHSSPGRPRRRARRHGRRRGGRAGAAQGQRGAPAGPERR